MNGEFSGKVVLVTGGGGGIGRGTALAFAKSGANVAIADIAEAGGNKTVELITQAGGTATFIRTDVTDAKAVENMVAKTVEAYGSLDVAFNNAGIEEEHMRLAECPEPIFDRVIGINVKGVWLCMKFELQQMLKQRGGAIVNTASIAGLGGAAKMAAYSASKHAVIGLTKSAAIEYARKNIRVNAVCPAVIRTEMYERALAADPAIGPRVMNMHPMGRLGEVEDVAAAVLWLASPAASFITGFPLAVDGGTRAL